MARALQTPQVLEYFRTIPVEVAREILPVCAAIVKGRRQQPEPAPPPPTESTKKQPKPPRRPSGQKPDLGAAAPSVIPAGTTIS